MYGSFAHRGLPGAGAAAPRPARGPSVPVAPPRALLVSLLLLALCPPARISGQAAAAPAVPTPESHFGFTPGENRRLADWSELTRFYDRVAQSSDRVAIDTIGSSTGGLPFVLLTITSPANHARLEELRQVQQRLADPRRVTDERELERLKETARTVVLLTAHIHSTEVGAGQMPANLVHHLATSTEAEVLEILDEVILLLIPSLNPDGTQLVADWYRRWVGTPFEGVDPVELYHPYVGHDNNRDWYALTQVETVLTVEHAHNAWRPMIVHDVHQMGPTGARIFVPPYVEPFERNVDPLIIGAINQLGSYVAAELLSQGKAGVVTGAQFDLFTPARAYQHYHAGARILSETASAALATPLQVRADQLTGGRGFDPRQPSINFPRPWPGGEWGLPEIVAYQQAAAMALLTNAARNRRFWVGNFHEIGRRAVAGWADWPRFWAMPDDPGTAAGRNAILRILTLGDVEVHQAVEAFRAGGRTFDAGTYVIPMNQPYAAFAQALLEAQDYPDLREYPGGPPVRPYDVTAHTLPLLMGVEAVPLHEPITAALSAPVPRVEATYISPWEAAGRAPPRIGIYRGWREPIAAGWTRWLFDQHRIAYDALTDADFSRHDLAERYDVILLQEQPAQQIVGGWRAGQQAADYVGGIGPEGVAGLRRFVESGGRLVAIESATELAIEAFALPVRNRVERVPEESFFIPGSILRLQLDPAHPMAAESPPESVAWFWRTSRAFDVGDPAVRVVARYGSGDPRLSGWVLGGQHVASQPAIVEMEVGRGSVVLFGFQPNYRGHSIATWPLLFKALD